MECEFLLDALLEGATLFKCERVRLGNDWHNVDNVRELLKDDDIDGLESMARRLNEEEAAVNAAILNVALSLGGQFLSKIRGVLIFDVFDDWIPASILLSKNAVNLDDANVPSVVID